jgi:tetratricopeptide (TPR) repeat protein
VAHRRGVERWRRPEAIVPALAVDPCKHRQVSEQSIRPDPDDADEPDNPDHESAYELLQRGQALMRARHNAQAAVVLERAARMEPGKASILEALGRAYFNSGQHERSRETFEALLEIDPSAHYAQFGLGQSLKKLGREREAWVHLRLAVALSPGTSLYRQALSRVPDPKTTGDEPES